LNAKLTPTAKLNAHSKAIAAMLGLRVWRSHACGTTRRTWQSQRITAMLSYMA